MKNYDNGAFMFDLILFMEDNGIEVYDETGNYRQANEVLLDLVHKSAKVSADVACKLTASTILNTLGNVLTEISEDYSEDNNDI